MGVAGMPSERGAHAPDTIASMRFNVVMNSGVSLWARREMRHGWSSLALLALLVALGGGAAVAAAAAARRTDTAFDRMLTATRSANLFVSVQNGLAGSTDLDPALLDRAGQIDGVRGLMAVAAVAVAPEGFRNYYAFAIIARRGDAPGVIRVDGRSVEDIESWAGDEVGANEAMRDQLGKGTGASLQLHSLTQEQFAASLEQDAELVPGGPAMAVRIVGVYRGEEDVSDAPDPFLIFPPAFYSKYRNAIGKANFAILINADPDAIDAVTAQLTEIYPQAGIGPPDPYASRIADTVALQQRAWWLICLVAALAGAVALFQASTRFGRILFAADGVHRALGMTRRERRLGRLLVIAPAGLVGAVGAAGVAYALSPLAPVGLTRRAEPYPGLRWEPAIVIPGIVVVLIVSFAVAGVGTVAVRRRAERLGTAGGLGGPVVALGTRLALGPGRGAIVGVLLSTAGLVGALTLERSIDHVLATPALYGADFDAGNFLTSGGDMRAVAEQLAPDPDIEAVGLVWVQLQTATMVRVVGPGGSVDVEPRAYESIKGTVTVRLTEGRAPGRADEVAVGRAVMDQLGADVGDRIIATGVNGAVQLTIVGDDLDPGVDVSGQGFALTLDGLATLADAKIRGTVVRFASGTDHAALIDRYSDLDLDAVIPPSEVGHIGQLGGLPGRVGQLLTLLGVAALLNAVVHTVRLGRRELAIHRALGFTGAQVISAHLWQGVITAVAGVAVGGSIGFIVGRAIHRELIGNVGAVAATVLPGAVWVVAFAILAACLSSSAITSTVSLRHRAGADLRAE